MAQTKEAANAAAKAAAIALQSAAFARKVARQARQTLQSMALAALKDHALDDEQCATKDIAVCKWLHLCFSAYGPTIIMELKTKIRNAHVWCGLMYQLERDYKKAAEKFDRTAHVRDGSAVDCPVLVSAWMQNCPTDLLRAILSHEWSSRRFGPIHALKERAKSFLNLGLVPNHFLFQNSNRYRRRGGRRVIKSECILKLLTDNIRRNSTKAMRVKKDIEDMERAVKLGVKKQRPADAAAKASWNAATAASHAAVSVIILVELVENFVKKKTTELRKVQQDAAAHARLMATFAKKFALKAQKAAHLAPSVVQWKQLKKEQDAWRKIYRARKTKIDLHKERITELNALD